MEDENLEITSTFDRVCNIFSRYSKLTCDMPKNFGSRVVLKMSEKYHAHDDKPFVLFYCADNMMAKKRALLKLPEAYFPNMSLPCLCSYWRNFVDKDHRLFLPQITFVQHESIKHELIYSDASKILAGLKECKTLAEINLELDMMGI